MDVSLDSWRLTRQVKVQCLPRFVLGALVQARMGPRAEEYGLGINLYGKPLSTILELIARYYAGIGYVG
eukprot:1326388-Amorphochlora_amoeboformis.AAC.1